MKKVLHPIICLLSLVLLVACKEKETPKLLEVPPAHLTALTAEGESKTLQINATDSWTVASTDPWCRVTPNKGDAQTTEVKVTVEPSMQRVNRTATLTFTMGDLKKEVQVTQQGKLIFDINRKQLEFTFSEGNQTIELEANDAWTLTSSESWCSADKSTGTTSEVIKVSVLANSGESDRTATLTFKMDNEERIVTVLQKGISLEMILLNERMVLEEFYHKAGGADWTSKDGWLRPNVPVGDWHGIKTNDAGRVVEIKFEFNGLKGEISSEIAKLGKLRKLIIKASDFKGAKIPDAIGDLTELTDLDLSMCLLGGTIPASLGKLSNLVVLRLENNELEGELPEALYELKSLVVLNLSRNRLKGNMSESISKMEKLEELSLGYNKGLQGTLAPIYKLTQLADLYLNDMSLSGEISADIAKLNKLERIGIDGNNLTGSLPKEIVSSPMLRYFDVSNNRLTGECPSEVLNREGMNWTNKYHWNRVFLQQEGFGFSNAPERPY